MYTATEYIFNVYTPLLCPIVFYEKNMKRPHTPSNHLPKVSDTFFNRIIPWVSWFGCVLFCTENTAVLFPVTWCLWQGIVTSNDAWTSMRPLIILECINDSTFCLQGVNTPEIRCCSSKQLKSHVPSISGHWREECIGGYCLSLLGISKSRYSGHNMSAWVFYFITDHHQVVLGSAHQSLHDNLIRGKS